MDHFYVTLPSNSSEDYYGKQPMSSYKTRLTKSLQLDVDDWEVGLAEIIYPHSWKNVSDGTFSVKLLSNTEWMWKDVEIPAALYETPHQLVQTMNDEVKQHLGQDQRDKIHFVYNHLLRKFTACLSPGYMVRFPKQLAITLGLGDLETTLKQARNEEEFGIERTDSRVIINDRKIIAPYCLDLYRGLHTFFIYCDIVQYQLVGDANVPLLRTIPVSGKSGDVVVNSFDNVHYLGLGRSTFQEIQVHITDDTGLRVPFEQGRVIVKLHFKKK